MEQLENIPVISKKQSLIAFDLFDSLEKLQKDFQDAGYSPIQTYARNGVPGLGAIHDVTAIRSNINTACRPKMELAIATKLLDEFRLRVNEKILEEQRKPLAQNRWEQTRQNIRKKILDGAQAEAKIDELDDLLRKIVSQLLTALKAFKTGPFETTTQPGVLTQAKLVDGSA